MQKKSRVKTGNKKSCCLGNIQLGKLIFELVIFFLIFMDVPPLLVVKYLLLSLLSAFFQCIMGKLETAVI